MSIILCQFVLDQLMPYGSKLTQRTIPEQLNIKCLVEYNKDLCSGQLLNKINQATVRSTLLFFDVITKMAINSAASKAIDPPK